MKSLSLLAAIVLWFTYGEDLARSCYRNTQKEREPQAAYDESYFKVGAGLNPPDMTQVAFGSHTPLLGSIIEQKEVGLWGDNKPIRGRSSSWYAQYGVGAHAVNGAFYAQAVTGVAYITDPDSHLGGHVQFVQDAGLGLLSEEGFGVGLSYKHVSSAGLYTPNKGRDFILLRLSLPW